MKQLIQGAGKRALEDGEADRGDNPKAAKRTSPTGIKRSGEEPEDRRGRPRVREEKGTKRDRESHLTEIDPKASAGSSAVPRTGAGSPAGARRTDADGDVELVSGDDDVDDSQMHQLVSSLETTSHAEKENASERMIQKFREERIDISMCEARCLGETLVDLGALHTMQEAEQGKSQIKAGFLLDLNGLKSDRMKWNFAEHADMKLMERVLDNEDPEMLLGRCSM